MVSSNDSVLTVSFRSASISGVAVLSVIWPRNTRVMCRASAATQRTASSESCCLSFLTTASSSVLTLGGGIEAMNARKEGRARESAVTRE